MLYFNNDYLVGAHPLILQKLMETNMDHTAGYGCDPYCDSAREKIRKACNCPDAQVHFLVGGTQTNATVITGLLRPYEGVLSPKTGHINVHEAGAIEAGGHKVITMPEESEKISALAVERYMEDYLKDGNRNHMVKPGMVYISHPTEYGTLYSKQELISLHEVCKKYNMPLFIDGARMGYGLMASTTDVSLETIAKYCDVFYIGGTKVGALFGEAVVITNSNILENFFTLIKRQGGLLAKGRLLGIQFDTLFTDDLYMKISKHAIDMAEKLRDGIIAKGYKLYYDSPTNQQFVIMDNTKLEKLANDVSFAIWEKLDANTSVIRLATSWATLESEIDALLELL